MAVGSTPLGRTCWHAGEELGPGGGTGTLSYHKLQRILFDVAKSAFPLALALHDNFAGYLTYSPNHCPDVTVLDAEGPGRHVIFDVATTQPMAEAHFGPAMMAPRAAAQRVEESKVATYGNMRPHQLIPFGVEVYGGLGPAAVEFLRKIQQRFGGRRYREEDVAEQEEVDEGEDMGEDEEAEVPLGCSMG